MLELCKIDLRRIEILGIGRNADSRTGVALAAIANAAQRLGDETGAEGDVIHATAALDFDFEPRRQGVGDRNADTVQTAGKAVGVARFGLVELAAGVQLAEDQFDRRPAFFRVDFDRDAATVVGNFNYPVGANGDRNLFGEAGQGLVGRVVDDFLNDVGRAGRPGVHAGTFLDGFQVFQDTDGGGGVFRHAL